tara:strand:- start:12614 stop:13552 length:939 start_codon:yes stop_codon:yes gene_type:complete
VKELSYIYKKCLILGANGFIGRNLVPQLKSHFFDVSTYSLNLSDEIIVDGVTNIIADFFDENALEKALENVDVVIHLVTTMTPFTSNQNPILDIQQNLIGSIKLLELCRSQGVKKIIYLSSGGTVYGDLSNVEKADEKHITNPSCSYGIIKLAFEKYLALYRDLYGIESVTLRVSNPYGPLQSCKKSQGVIASFLDKVINDEILEIWGDGSAVRDFIYIDDLISAVIKSISYTGSESVFNIGSGRGDSLNEILSTISSILNEELDIIYVKDKNAGVKRNVLDNFLAMKELEWRPVFSLRDGLKKTIYYWNNI